MMKKVNKLLFVLLVVIISLISIPLQGLLLGNLYEFNSFRVIASNVIKISDINGTDILNNGDLVEFGSYPQTLMVEDNLINELNDIPKKWISYRYMKPETSNVEDDFMKYADLDVNNDGIYDYRAVTFSKYRSRYAIDYDSSPVSYQDDNGYKTNTIYYFKFEPIVWRVLDAKTGLIFSEELIDAQHYNKYLYWNGSRYTNLSGYANDWTVAYIREWLNGVFYNTSFSTNEKDIICTSTINNKSYDNAYNYPDTSDKVYLLSYSDMLNTDYGFSSSETTDAARKVKNLGTDYAKCQGLWGGQYYLRTAGFYSQSDSIVSVRQNGSIDYGAHSHSWDNYGIRPAMRIHKHSYSDWIIIKRATLFCEGEKKRVCSSCGNIETVTIEKVQVDINENDNYGIANLTIVNAQTLKPIKGANIFVSTENDGESTFKSDENGKMSIILPVGKQTISVYANGYLTRNAKINIKSGVNEVPQIGLSDRPVYDVEINHHLMDIDEIKSVGIDTSAPENQHIYKYELKLEFQPEVDISSIVAYFNADGKFIGGYSPEAAPSTSEPPKEEGEEGSTEPQYTLHYHVVTDGFWHTWCKNIDVEKGEREYLSYRPWRDDSDYIFDGWYTDADFTEKIYAVDIEDQKTTVYGRWIYTGDEPESERPQGIRVPIKNNKNEDEVITVYPVSEYFYLIVRGEIKWLKEMFDVEMLIINNSMTDTLENLTASLTLPDGLSLAAMIGEEQSLVQKIDCIAEGESETVHWYVRGDKEGSYDLEARLQGMIMPFQEPIDDYFKATKQLQVWAGNAFNLHFEFPNAAYYGEDYPITITLTNVSDRTLYNVSHMIQLQQGMEVYYSDGTSKKKVETSSWLNSGVVREFRPGDKLIIETLVNIIFESELIEHEIEKLIGIVDGVEQFLNAFKAVKTAVDATDALINCVSGCTKALDDFDFTLATESTKKMKLFEELYSRISDLSLKYTTSGNRTIDAAVKLANTGVNASLNAITSNPEEWLKNHTEKDIRELLNNIEILGSSFDVSGSNSRKFDVYDSIRTAISSIPVRFVLKNIIMTEDEDNTTSIPWSYSVTQTSEHYFGVSNVSKYLMSLSKAILGEVYDEAMPWYLQLIPGLDDPFNQKEAIKYIQATEDEVAQFKAKDATGKVVFRAWVERNTPEVTYRMSKTINSEYEDFILSCNNETAEVNDGVLTFVGDGIINVTPQNQNGGTLYIEDSEGNLYTYVISVVEKHICITSTQETIISPTDDYNGFAVKCCKVCEELMEIIPLDNNICESHIFCDWKVDFPASCKSGGLDSRCCTICGYTETRFTAKSEHSVQLTNEIKATCTVSGYSGDQVCQECNNIIAKGDIVAAMGHSTTVTVVKIPTCIEKGVEKTTCLQCDYYTERVIDEIAHNYQDGVCTVCDKLKVENCSHMCHKSGFRGFLWRIFRFFWKLFKMNPICECGIKHY